MADLEAMQIDILLDDTAPDMSATQKRRMEDQALNPGGLVPGGYYRGYLGNTGTIGRWNGQQYRFVVWTQEKGESKLKGRPARPGIRHRRCLRAVRAGAGREGTADQRFHLNTTR